MDFATLHLDTYKVVKLLQSKGYTKKEAEGFIEAIQEITLTGAATKQDISDIRVEIQEVKDDLKQDIQDVRSEMKDAIQGVKEEIHNFKNETLKFQIIQTITLVGVMIALFQFF